MEHTTEHTNAEPETRPPRGLWLIASGIALAIFSYVLYSIRAGEVKADHAAEVFVDELVDGYSFAVEPTVNSTPYLVMGVVAGILFLAGIILYAGDSD